MSVEKKSAVKRITIFFRLGIRRMMSAARRGWASVERTT
jgi:hypothetical protein